MLYEYCRIAKSAVRGEEVHPFIFEFSMAKALKKAELVKALPEHHKPYRTAYRAARLNQAAPNDLESIAAIIAVQDSRKPDIIGHVSKDARDFLEFIEEKTEKRERLADLKSRRRVRAGRYAVVEFEPQEAPIYHDALMDDFESVYADR